MRGEYVIELFITDCCPANSAGYVHRDPRAELVRYHRREHECLHVMFIAFALKGFVQIQRLFPCSKLDFHRPARAIHGYKLAGFRFCGAEVGQHEVPAVANESLGTGCFAALFGFFSTLGTTGCGDFGGGAHGDEAAFYAFLTYADFGVDEVVFAAFEGVFQGAGAFVFFDVGSHVERQAGEPVGLFFLDVVELGEGEVAHVAQYQVAGLEVGE